jgi:signal transduction histidine kinase
VPAARLSPPRLFAAAILVAVGLVLIGWFDYATTRSELLQMLREQATALRQTVAAAARANDSAAAQAEEQVRQRLVDNARLLAELDRQQGLTQALLSGIAERNHLFRVAVFAPDGSRELWSSEGGGLGKGFPGPGLQPLLQRAMAGGDQDVITELHSARRGGGGAGRAVAAVRRARGGVIMLNADAAEIDTMLRDVSLDGLIQNILASTPQLAYISFVRGDYRVAHGDVPASEQDPGSAGPPAGGDLVEREVRVQDRAVLEFSGPIAVGGAPDATLKLGLRLDVLRRAERRLLVGLVASLAAALALSLLAFGTAWLSQSYAALSDRHAAAEAALRRRDRLSAMGELASTVAHEVRNPLNAIAMSAQRLRREFLDSTSAAGETRVELEQLLGVVAGETRRIDGIVQQFLEFARPPALAPRRADLGEQVRDWVDSVRPVALNRGVELEADLGAAGPAVFDPAQLRQAVENLVRNAIEATASGGRVAVTARSTPREHTIEVRDSGSGIAAEDLPRIFDLYYTTKPNGTGVGLAVSHQIVTAHGGAIEVSSEPGVGTRMTIRIPAGIEGSVHA